MNKPDPNKMSQRELRHEVIALRRSIKDAYSNGYAEGWTACSQRIIREVANVKVKK